MQVFISYAHYPQDDKIFIIHLCEQVKAWGYKVWLDDDIKPGENFNRSIHQAESEATIVIGILTPESVLRQYVDGEWTWALQNNKTLILVMLREVEKKAIPPAYANLDYIDFTKDKLTKYAELRQALDDRNVGKSKQPQDLDELLQPPALDTSNSVNPRHPHFQLITRIQKQISEKYPPQYGLLKLKWEHQPDTVSRSWDEIEDDDEVELDDEVEDDDEVELDDDIYGEFEDSGHTLLIMGSSGSGKTTLLYQLANEILNKVKNNEKERIPFILNLGKWSPDTKLFLEWIKKQLEATYKLPSDTINKIINTSNFVLLLDGFCELDEEQRKKCINAINIFRRGAINIGIVICSSSDEYTKLDGNKFWLNAAISLKPMSRKQIFKYLENEDLAPIRYLFAIIPTKLETPLQLYIFMVAFYGLSSNEIFKNYTTIDVDGDYAVNNEFFSRSSEQYITQCFDKWSFTLYSKNDVVMWLGQCAVAAYSDTFSPRQKDWYLDIVRSYIDFESIAIMILSSSSESITRLIGLTLPFWGLFLVIDRVYPNHVIAAVIALLGSLMSVVIIRRLPRRISMWINIILLMIPQLIPKLLEPIGVPLLSWLCRFRCYHKGYLPQDEARYLQFFEDAVQNGILRKINGKYQFVDELVEDYFSFKHAELMGVSLTFAKDNWWKRWNSIAKAFPFLERARLYLEAIFIE
jgi:hypothetical protein